MKLPFSKLIISLILALLLAPQADSFTLPQDDPFLIEGLNKCQEFITKKTEHGQYLELPAFQENISGPKFKMYYWTLQKFNPLKPSLVLIPGGPGQTFHQLEWVNSEKINMIYFDPRGMGCSTPTLDNLINNPEFYSSEKVAQDLDSLRKFLNIKKWSVYGHSFGTIPATIYAAKFPDQTRSLILEGTVHEGGKNFWHSPARKELVENVWQSLPSSMKEKILASFNQRPNSTTWFSQTLLDNLPQGFSPDHFNERLQRNLKSLNTRDIIPTEYEIEDITPYFSRSAHLILSCKELEADLYSIKRLFSFSENKFHQFTDMTYEKNCSEWKIIRKTFNHKNFPIKVPTYYLQGEFDYLTLTKDAHVHYLNNKSDQKYFITLKNGGHNPLSLSLNTFNRETKLNPLALNLIEKMAAAEALELNDFIEFQNLGLSWHVEKAITQ
jgi:proline iminopeptidase